jgi:hypothetical protein
VAAGEHTLQTTASVNEAFRKLAKAVDCRLSRLLAFSRSPRAIDEAHSWDTALRDCLFARAWLRTKMSGAVSNG